MSQKKTPKKYKPKKKYQKDSRKFFRLSLSYVLFSIFLIVFIFFGALVLLTSTIAPTITEPFSDETSNKQEFIERTADYAQILEEKYAILPSVSIAQAILESDWGRSELSLKNNNFFGIKGSDPEQTVVMNTKEFVDGQWIEVEAPFRKYTSWQESMDDHAKLFVEGTTWNPDQYAAVLAAKDYKEAAHALEASGYATDPDYPEKLISLIEEFNLNQYD